MVQILEKKVNKPAKRTVPTFWAAGLPLIPAPPEWSEVVHLSYLPDLLIPFLICSLIASFLTARHFYRRLIDQERRTAELESQLLDVERQIQCIKISPQVLFSTISAIDHLMEKDSKMAARALLDLSDLMRRSLYSPDVQASPLRSQIQHFRNVHLGRAPQKTAPVLLKDQPA